MAAPIFTPVELFCKEITWCPIVPQRKDVTAKLPIGDTAIKPPTEASKILHPNVSAAVMLEDYHK